MSNGKEIQLPAGVAAPDRVGQATAIEQSRAIAEVQGAIIVAQRCPRNVIGAANAMRESCQQKYLADRAFFEVRRGGSPVTGATIHLARELARVWGNVQYGVSEMRRDDVHGQSEMLAFAWDVQTNTRVETKFVVPHIRDRSAEKGGPVKLTSMDDIYQTNANAGARRVRECIFSILPPWFLEEAKSLCYKTIEDGGGKPLEQRVADAIRLFDQEMGVTVDQLVKKIGRSVERWTSRDVASLSVTYQSLSRNEITIEEAFEPDIPSAKDFPDTPSAPPPTIPAAEPDPTPFVSDEDLPKVLDELNLTPDPPGRNGAKARRAQVTALSTLLKDNGVESDEDQLAVVSLLVDYPVAALVELKTDEVSYLYSRIPALVEGGTFEGTIERARQMAAAR